MRGTIRRTKPRQALRRGKDGGIADVPTVLPAAKQATTAQPTAEDEAVNESVRRMVEAAYT